jgi:large subunit ribosomal protein L30
MSKIKITQVRSSIDYPSYQRRTLEALGIRKMHGSVEKEATPQIQGMVLAVKHLVKVENI